MRGFLRRLCGAAHADDLAQITFLKAWRAAGSFRGEGSYEGWLLSIAWTQFLSERRRQPDAREVEPRSQGASSPSQPDPEARFDVERALAALPERERAATLLCLGEGWSHADAAIILGIPLGTLKSLVARARTKLAAKLEGHRP